jgi:hypothetical protein
MGGRHNRAPKGDNLRRSVSTLLAIANDVIE